MTVALQHECGNHAEGADGDIGQAQAEHPRYHQQKRDDEQRYGNLVQHRIARVTMMVKAGAPLPGREVGVTFAHDADP